MFDELHVFDDLEGRDAADNMAIDEALLESGIGPSLRFYRWKRPALSFGYFGRYADAAEEGLHREIVRRWTGGGIVPHGDDLTYSVVIPAGDSQFAKSSPEIYATVHSAISRALNENGVIVFRRAEDFRSLFCKCRSGGRNQCRPKNRRRGAPPGAARASPPGKHPTKHADREVPE